MPVIKNPRLCRGFLYNNDMLFLLYLYPSPSDDDLINHKIEP